MSESSFCSIAYMCALLRCTLTDLMRMWCDDIFKRPPLQGVGSWSLSLLQLMWVG